MQGKMEDSNSYSHMQHGQFGGDSAHNNAQLQGHDQHGVGGVYDSAHHQGGYSGGSSYNNLPPGYPHGHVGMAYYHPSMYGFPPTMVNPASMGTGSQSASAAGSAPAGHAAAAGSQGGANDSNAASQHYMHFGPGQHHYFAQPGMMPGVMQHGQLQPGQQHGQQAGQHHGQPASLQVQGFPHGSALPAAGGHVGNAGASKKLSAKTGRPKKIKEGAANAKNAAQVNAAAAAVAAAAAGMPGMLAMNPALAVSGKGKAGKVDARKKPEKEQKKVIRSHLKQPKQAPSAWQLFFAEELSKLKAQKPEERLNVAHVAKGAGERYNMLPDSEKAKYHKESLRLKAQWERDMQAWKESLSPEDIKLENAYRTQQRKAGKSRKSNLKDPHAPKKPLSAYFLFLRAIRSDPKMTDDVFGKEGETTKQSVLAAAKWRELSDTEKQPFLAKADQDKLRYEEARRVYESAQARGVPPAEAAAEAERAGKAAAQAMADKNPTLQALQAAGLPAGISFNMDDESNNPKHHLNTAFDDADDSDSRDQVGRDQHLQTKGSGRAGTGSRATKAERIG